MNDRPIQILLVEDNRGDARLIQVMLTGVDDPGIEITHVACLDDALSCLNERSSDVVLLDLDLPDSRGLDSFTRMHRRAPTVPVVLLTGMDDEELATTAVSAGAQDYLVKGQVDGDLLMRTVRYAIARAWAEEEVRKARDELEQRVVERTAELTEANKQLQREIVERKRAEEALRLEDARLEALVQLNEMADAPFRQVADFTLEQAVHVTESKLGFLGFMNDDESVMTIHAWSQSTMKECAVADKPMAFRIVEAGFWGEAVRQRRPIIVNDYPALKTWKRGLPDGHIRISRFLAMPVFDGERIVAVAGVANKKNGYEDRDARQLTLLLSGMWRFVQRQRVRQSLQFTQFAVDHNSDATYWVRSDGRICYANHAACRALGYTYDELVSMTVPDIDPDFPRDVWPAHFKELKEARSITFEAHHRTKTGHVFPVEIHSNYLEYDGEEYIWAYVRDITERKRAECELQEQHGLLQAIVEGTTDAIFVKDLDGRYLMVNSAAAQAFGRSAGEILGRDDRELLPAESAGRLMAADQRIIATGRAMTVEEPILLGKVRRTYSTIKAPYRDGSGNLIGVLGIARDVTEQRRLEEEILAISRLEQQRIGQDLHDAVGQHLTAIAVQAKILEKKLVGQALPETDKASQITRMVNEAIIQTRALAKGLCPVDAAADGLMRGLQDFASNVEALFGVVCTFRCDGPILVHDETVATHLYRIAQEAVNNAVKHGRARRIAVDLADGNGCLTLTVEDDGVGLPDSVRDSTGMGLRIMHYRARMIGATLDIRRNPDGGTIVQCSLQSDSVTGGESNS